MSLGSLMQAAAAFAQVQMALNWLVDNAIRLAEWFASAQRVVELVDAVDELEDTIGRYGTDETVVLGKSPDDAIHIEHLSIKQQNGSLMIDGADAVIGQGEKVLVKGESGTGKSTLIRTMAGLWPWGSGKILRPEKAAIAFMPQRPYMPLGTLRHALLYPAADLEVADETLRDALGAAASRISSSGWTRRTNGTRSSPAARSSGSPSPGSSSIRPTSSSWTRPPRRSTR